MFGKKKKIEKKIEEFSKKVEDSKLKEYVILMENTKLLLWKNFISGVAKGIGTAIGFTILAAIILIILRRAVLLNIPVIGKYLKDILDIVETST